MLLLRLDFIDLMNDMYRQGIVVIVNVYTYEKDGNANVGITYHYRR